MVSSCNIHASNKEQTMRQFFEVIGYLIAIVFVGIVLATMLVSCLEQSGLVGY